MKLLLILLCAVLSTSCSGVYSSPPKNPALTAEIKNESRMVSAFSRERFLIEMIDQKTVLYFPDILAATKSNRLTKGRHEVVACCIFNRGLKGPYKAQAKLFVELTPGRTYQVNGAVKGANVHLWVEDALTHERVCTTMSAPHEVEMPEYYPIYIPVAR